MNWTCVICRRPIADRTRNCDCPTSRLTSPDGERAKKISKGWRDELRAAVYILNQGATK